MHFLLKILKKLNRSAYVEDESGMSFMETAILFPILLSMMMAVYDLGQGVVVNQKTVAASQVIADLVARYETVDVDLVTDIVNAGELALAPYPVNDTFGYDIISVEFDDESDPTVLWRVTENMDQDESTPEATTGLGGPGEGVVMVSVVYEYKPFFSNFIVDTIRMNEQAFLRGRKSVTVPCSDCP